MNTTEETNSSSPLSWSCNGPSPSAAQHVQWIIDAGPEMMARMFVPLPLLVIMYILFIDTVIFQIRHSVHWRRTAYTIWLLGIFPILATLCVISFLAPRSLPVASFASSFYFAVAVKKFFHLILNYYGGKRKMEEALKADKVVSSNPFPCCFVCCCCNQPMSVRRINYLQITVYQIVFAYPIGLFIQLLLVVDGVTQTSIIAQLVVTVLGLLLQLSSFFCLYGYIILAKSSYYALQQFHFRAKYLSVQLVIAFNTVQRFTLKTIYRFNWLPCGFPFPSKEVPLLYHSYLLFYELFILSIFAWYFYKTSDEGCEVLIREPSDSENNTDCEDEKVVEIPMDKKDYCAAENKYIVETINEKQDKNLPALARL